MFKFIYFSKRYIPVFGVLGALLTLGVYNTALADYCVRHIYNNSHANWTFTVHSSSGSLGSPVMIGDNCPPDSTSCTSIPGGVIEITYYPAQLPLMGSMDITDQLGNKRNFEFMPDPSNCEYISHDGDTGAVAVNDSAGGDFSVYGDNWNPGKKK